MSNMTMHEEHENEQQRIQLEKSAYDIKLAYVNMLTRLSSEANDFSLYLKYASDSERMTTWADFGWLAIPLLLICSCIGERKKVKKAYNKMRGIEEPNNTQVLEGT
jgi:hypothetical protein